MVNVFCFCLQLQSQLEVVKKELSLRGIDIEAAHQELQCEREEKVRSEMHLLAELLIMSVAHCRKS